MKSIYNPHETVLQELSELKKLIIQIRDEPKEDFTFKFYTRKEASVILRTTTQSIDAYGRNGWIVIEDLGPKGKLINHYQIFNRDNSIKQFKYKRKDDISLNHSA